MGINELETTLTGHSRWVLSLTTFMEQDKICLASGDYGSIMIWDLVNYNRIKTLSIPGDLYVSSITTYYDDGDDSWYLVSGHTDGSIMYWSDGMTYYIQK